MFLFIFIGRSFTENVANNFLLSVPCTYELCENVENFALVHSRTSEQHVELRSSRISRDKQDLQKILTWFNTHSPFPKVKEIVCIANGTVGNSSVNCHEAFQIGSKILSGIV